MLISFAMSFYYSNNVIYNNANSTLSATNVQDALDELYANSDAYLAGLNAAHPIGSIFMTVNSNYNTAAKVGTALGGTWQAIGQGRVLIGAGTGTDTQSNSESFTAGTTSGTYKHKHDLGFGWDGNSIKFIG